MKHPDLQSLIERGQRLADGMTVNRDALARDLKRACEELAQRRDLGVPQAPKKPSSPFADGFWGGL